MATTVETNAKIISKTSQTKALANYHNNEARELANQGKFMPALEHVEIALRYSYSMNTIKNKAHILFMKKDFNESIQLYQLALSVGRVNKEPDTELAALEYELSNAYAQNGDIQEARNHFRTYLQLKGFIENVYLNDSGDNNKEIKDTRIRIQLIEAELELATGNWFVEVENYQEAINSLKKAYSIYKIHGFNFNRANSIQNQIANAYMCMENISEARKFYSYFVQDGGTHLNELHQLLDDQTKSKIIDSHVENLIGTWYASNGFHLEAAKYFTLANKKYKLWATPLYNVAKQYYLLNKNASCIGTCKDALKSGKKNGAPKWQLAKILTLSGDAYAKKHKFKKAIVKYDKSNKLNNLTCEEAQEVSYYTTKQLLLVRFKLAGQKLQLRGHYLEAIEEYKKCIEHCKDDVDLYFSIGSCYYFCGSINMQIKYYKIAMDTNPTRFIQIINRLISSRSLF